MKMNKRYIHLMLGAVLMASCSSQSDVLPDAQNDDASIIHVGQVSVANMLGSAAVTRSSSIIGDDKLSWLEDGLRKGMNIYYFKDSEEAGLQAILKLENNNTYSLKTPVSATDTERKPCKWLGNGEHTFQGAYVPTALYEKDTKHTYTDLERYTAMPPATTIAATVGSITIPLQHRLARVVAYVLIDGMDAKLKGYNQTTPNADDIKLRFCNVWTLDYVDGQGHPIWKQERKATPNYLGVEPIRVYKDSKNKLIFPVDKDNWKAADDAYKANPTGSGYTYTDYDNAPYFDLIVRPTYKPVTTGTNVMNDELTDNKTDSYKNYIDFELTLDNDLEYEKQVEFDLNANDETVVYLRVSPERIDYNSTGSRLWKASSYSDNYYGVNNENDNYLSEAGSSWQRAYTNSELKVDVTDGHYYDADEEAPEAQYVSDEKWISMLLQACEGGDHHGDYFILKKNITINTDVVEFPENFVFTGHLDALDNTIIITGKRAYLFDGLNGEYVTKQENVTTDRKEWEANVRLEGTQWVPAAGWRAEIVNTNISGASLFGSNPSITGFVNNCTDSNGTVTNHTPTIPSY